MNTVAALWLPHITSFAQANSISADLAVNLLILEKLTSIENLLAVQFGVIISDTPETPAKGKPS